MSPGCRTVWSITATYDVKWVPDIVLNKSHVWMVWCHPSATGHWWASNGVYVSLVSRIHVSHFENGSQSCTQPHTGHVQWHDTCLMALPNCHRYANGPVQSTHAVVLHSKVYHSLSTYCLQQFGNFFINKRGPSNSYQVLSTSSILYLI